jgi:Na+/H+-translocating membrane pyrophosphatase
MEDFMVTLIIFLFVLLGLAITVTYWNLVTAYDEEVIKAKEATMRESGTAKLQDDSIEEVETGTKNVFNLIGKIKHGAQDFLKYEYRVMAGFIVVFGIIIFLLTGLTGKATFSEGHTDWKKTTYSEDWMFGFLSTCSFVVGALTSMSAGYIGMSIAVVCNGRVTMKCWREPSKLREGFSMAIRGGMVMGFGLLSLGLLNLLILLGLYKLYYTKCNAYNDCELNILYDALAAYGLGGSSIALFGRVGGGIYTKAADVGADLFGKIEEGFDEDDARNPAVVADNVGDNVGDIAGMGSDLFGSFAEGTCAAMVVLSSANNCIYFTDGNVQAMANSYPAMMFPISITASGIVVCFVTSLFATSFLGEMKMDFGEKGPSYGVAGGGEDDRTAEQKQQEKEALYNTKKENPVEDTLKNQLVISTVLMTPMIFLMAWWLLPTSFFVSANLGVYGSAPDSDMTHKSVCESASWDGITAQPYSFGNWSFDVSTGGKFHGASSVEDAFKGGYTGSCSGGTAKSDTHCCMGQEGSLNQEVQWWEVAICVLVGLWAGLVIGFITEYYTSNTYAPVKDIAFACENNGAAVNIIYGLALGYLSVVIPVISLTIAIYTGFALAQMFGVACAALGMLSNMAICLTIDGYGPISDNAGGIAEMVPQIPEDVRQLTDALDAAGNTTAAIGKGFAIGSAAMVALALFGGYCTRADIKLRDVSILNPMVFAGLLLGAMIPYWFSAMTMKSVGKAATAMMEECRVQFEKERAGTWWKEVREAGLITEEELQNKFEIVNSITSGETLDNLPPDCWYTPCIKVATEESLREMIAPASLVMFSPLIMGIFFGKFALSGLLVGAVVSGVQVALSASNTGGAWDNAKKFVEGLGKKKSPWHEAVVVGDTVGDPLKDTSGPAVNIVMKLMAIIALVCAPFIASTRDGYGLIGCSISKDCHA